MTATNNTAFSALVRRSTTAAVSRLDFLEMYHKLSQVIILTGDTSSGKTTHVSPIHVRTNHALFI